MNKKIGSLSIEKEKKFFKKKIFLFFREILVKFHVFSTTNKPT